jgi:GcrA cell cycle regulator
MSKSWDNGILKKLKALVGKGLTTAEIGKRLGISKNAVVGKLHRLGWVSKTNDASIAKKSKTAKKTVSESKKTLVKKVTPKPSKKTPGKTVTKTETKVTLKKKPTEKSKRTGGRGFKESTVHQRMVQHALEMANLKPNQCRWPIGDPDSEGFHFCGQPVFVGKPYCYEHCKQAYQFTPPKKK